MSKKIVGYRIASGTRTDERTGVVSNYEYLIFHMVCYDQNVKGLCGCYVESVSTGTDWEPLVRKFLNSGELVKVYYNRFRSVEDIVSDSSGSDEGLPF